MEKLIELKHLFKHYPVLGGLLRRQVNAVKALDGIDLDILKGECLGLVGESGCGKTTTGKAIVKLHEATRGEILFHYGNSAGEDRVIDIVPLKNRIMKQKGIRGRLQMVFQDPTTSMNPRMLIKNIIAEPIREQVKLRSRELETRIKELLGTVGLGSQHLLRYPHEFSGGQRQRLAIARAIATNPDFIVLDEPTSALDVSVQAQILNLLKELQEKMGMTYLFVTHHLLVVKYISSRIAVMYLGKIVEIAKTEDLFNNSMHPYTLALFSAIPSASTQRKSNQIILEGDVPSPLNPPNGCRFHPRCPFAEERCETVEPTLEDVGNGQKTACHRKDVIHKLVRDTFGFSLRQS